MSRHEAIVTWSRADRAFAGGDYSRVHEWRFDGGATVRASASPHIVAPPNADAGAVDPEEAFVASLSSCHMLWFLDLASKASWIVDRYEDAAVGTLGRNETGQLAMTRVVLRPAVAFTGPAPTEDEVRKLHEKAHDLCFLAASVKTPITIEPRSL